MKRSHKENSRWSSLRFTCLLYTSNTIMVMTAYPGASASDIENNVTRPLENVLNLSLIHIFCIMDDATVEVTGGVITYVGPNRGEDRDGYYQRYWHYNARRCV